MDYYSTLGVGRNASQAEIKKAYKKQSMQHHPDRTGGDDTKFKEINEAYQTLNDPQKKQMYDQFGTTDPNQAGPQGFHFRSGDFSGMGGFDDIFENFFGMRQQRRPVNRNIDIALDISLEDALNGKQIAVEVQLGNGTTKVLDLNIPPGADAGQKIRFGGMGDSSVAGIPPGDLFVHIRIRNHPRFTRNRDNIMCELKVDVLDLILGTTKGITTLGGKTLQLIIPPGTQIDTVLSCKGEGIPNVRTKMRGDLHIKIKGTVPKNLTEEQKTKIKNARN